MDNPHWIESAKRLLALRPQDVRAADYLDAIVPRNEEQATVIATARYLIGTKQ